MKVGSYKLAGGIAATLHSPSTDDKRPVIILCHGFCGIQEILLPAFAEAFAAAGFIAVTFDYLGFGDSGGERGRLIPSLQIDDIVTVIDWVKTFPQVDKERIGLWGTSLGACHVFGAAVQRPDIRCLVSQLGFADGEEIVTGKMSLEEKQGFIQTLDKMSEKRKISGKEMFVPITKVLGDEESKVFFDKNKEYYPEMNIKIPFLTVRETLQYKPLVNARETRCPSLVVVAGNDTVNPPEQGIALYEAIGAEIKSVHLEKGASHYEMYEGEHFNNVIKLQLNWFRKYLYC